MRIEPGCEVDLEVELVGEDGEELGADEDGRVTATLGAGELPPRLEEALAGKREGDRVEVTCPPGEAFGEYSPEAIFAVPRAEFGADVELAQGAEVALTVEHDDAEAEEVDARVVEVDAESVVLDVNHPLAGREVTFRARIAAVRRP